jgi:hypothetical protein
VPSPRPARQAMDLGDFERSRAAVRRHRRRMRASGRGTSDPSAPNRRARRRRSPPSAGQARAALRQAALLRSLPRSSNGRRSGAR